MRTNWRATCLGLMVLSPLLTACGGGDDGATTETATTSGAPGTGVYGEPDPNVVVPTEVATDAPPTPTRPAPSPAPSAVPSAAPDPGSAVTSVAPRLTYFGWNADIGAVEAGGIVPTIVESGGRCTLTLTQGTATADASSEAIDNVTSTSCSEMVVPGERLTPGTWRAVLTYESDAAEGASEPVEIEVP